MASGGKLERGMFVECVGKICAELGKEAAGPFVNFLRLVVKLLSLGLMKCMDAPVSAFIYFVKFVVELVM